MTSSAPLVYLVAGLPGSGKTTFLTRRARELRAKLFDDYHAYAFGNLGELYYSRHFAELVTLLEQRITCIVADVIYCKTQKRAECELVLRKVLPQIEIRWWFFESDAAQCRLNVNLRDR